MVHTASEKVAGVRVGSAGEISSGLTQSRYFPLVVCSFARAPCQPLCWPFQMGLHFHCETCHISAGQDGGRRIRYQGSNKSYLLACGFAQQRSPPAYSSTSCIHRQWKSVWKSKKYCSKRIKTKPRTTSSPLVRYYHACTSTLTYLQTQPSAAARLRDKLCQHTEPISLPFFRHILLHRACDHLKSITITIITIALFYSNPQSQTKEKIPPERIDANDVGTQTQAHTLA